VLGTRVGLQRGSARHGVDGVDGEPIGGGVEAVGVEVGVIASQRRRDRLAERADGRRDAGRRCNITVVR